jgi:hypothetical protein
LTAEYDNDGQAVPVAAYSQGARPDWPLDLLAEGSAVFELAASRAGFALTWDRNRPDAELVQLVLDTGFAVAAVGGHRDPCRATTHDDIRVGLPVAGRPREGPSGVGQRCAGIVTR